jgi:2-(1,2-epoxy-1,2-dihydrophenyl)acetyl-CoA isomerase
VALTRPQRLNAVTATMHAELREALDACAADPMPAKEAERMGLVYKVYDDATFAAETATLAQRLAAGPAAALQMTKQASNASVDNDLDAQLQVERELQQQAGRMPDFMEAVTAFREKQKPRIGGR